MTACPAQDETTAADIATCPSRQTSDDAETNGVLDGILWPDAALERIHVDYDSISLQITEASDKLRTLSCEGYIGYRLCGFWDEAIIERVELVPAHPFIDACVSDLSARLGQAWPDSGNEQRNTREWKALVLHLLDGARLEIVAAEFRAI